MNAPESSTPPPPRLRRLYLWLFGWRTVRRGLVGLGIFITLIALVYTVENIRGKRAWAKCKKELEAKGVVFNWNALIPPPVPDDQNFFKAPGMQEWFVGRGSTELSKRLQNPVTSSVGAAQNAITNAAAAEDYLKWSDQFEPDFNLIRDALKRPYARMDGDYTHPYSIPIPRFVTLRILAQTLAQRAHCYFLLGQPEKALRELTLMLDLCRMLATGRPMTIVAAMIDVAITGLHANMVAEGLRLQAWREPQLIALEEQLSKINLIPLLSAGFADERVATAHTFEHTVPADIADPMIELSGAKPTLWRRLKNPIYSFIKFAPRGWVYQNMVRGSAIEGQFLDGLQADQRLVLPDKADAAYDNASSRLGGFRPYTFLCNYAVPNFRRAIQTLARNQTLADEARVACALERYRLANGNYPETLDAVAPRFIDKFPHDVIGGQPLKYRRTDNGKYLLYSIGWNEQDDGGQSTMNDQRTERLDDGDWVWQVSAK
jgi:hypothetical protein